MSFTVSHGNGIAIKYNDQTVLLDPHFADFISIVSHAHSDHLPEEIIKKPFTTEETKEFAKIRNPLFDSNTVKEGKLMKLDGLSIKLLSSGHVLGSTQTLIEADGTTILYSGDFKLKENLTCKKIDIQHADVLITEATYGHPTYQIPDSEIVRKQLVKWVEEQMKKKKVDIGAYTLGKAQEAIRILNDKGIVPQVSDMVRKFSESYRKFGVKLEFLGKDEGGDVFVKPMHVVPQTRNPEIASCVLTGWAGSRDYGCKAFPLSDHADFNELIEFVKAVNPKRVYCVHGYDTILAKEIKRRLKIQTSTLAHRKQKLLTDF